MGSRSEVGIWANERNFQSMETIFASTMVEFSHRKDTTVKGTALCRVQALQNWLWVEPEGL